jgi:hypothetical protein
MMGTESDDAVEGESRDRAEKLNSNAGVISNGGGARNCLLSFFETPLVTASRYDKGGGIVGIIVSDTTQSTIPGEVQRSYKMKDTNRVLFPKYKNVKPGYDGIQI